MERRSLEACNTAWKGQKANFVEGGFLLVALNYFHAGGKLSSLAWTVSWQEDVERLCLAS